VAVPPKPSPHRRPPPLNRVRRTDTSAARPVNPNLPDRATGPERPLQDRPSSVPPLDAQGKQQLADQALGLLREQLEAQVVLYKSELQTSPELDAITAQVVHQLRQFQQSATLGAKRSDSPVQVEQQLVTALERLLRRLVVEDHGYPARAIPPVGRQLAKRFFEAALHANTADNQQKVINSAEQGVFLALRHYSKAIRETLGTFSYASEDIETSTNELYHKLQRDLQVAFLSRRSPELNQAMTVFTNVLVSFIRERMPEALAELCRVAIVRANAARYADAVGYKIRTASFGAFKAAFEGGMVREMIDYCTNRFLAELSQSGHVAEETEAFFTDPHVYSITCVIMCNDMYDYLYLEGFLDIPADWRTRSDLWSD
jgi:hypothetical protein